MWIVPLHLVCFFFFQAEDGIRDLVRSRGLGDVYKRQGQYHGCVVAGAFIFSRSFVNLAGFCQRFQRLTDPVSYTHLTLPTIYSV